MTSSPETQCIHSLVLAVKRVCGMSPHSVNLDERRLLCHHGNDFIITELGSGGDSRRVELK